MRSLDATDETIASALLDSELSANYNRAEYDLRDRLINRMGLTGSDVDTTVMALSSHHGRAVEVAESPIEKLLLPWLIAAPCHRFRLRLARVAFIDDDERPRPRDLRVVPQLVFGRYRLDFAVVGQIGGRTLTAAVECDGREFHHMPNDAVRDRYLAAYGIPTVRATGSEITARPDRVAQRVADLFERWIDGEDVCGGV